MVVVVVTTTATNLIQILCQKRLKILTLSMKAFNIRCVHGK